VAQRQIHYVDSGTSGGVWGLAEGYSLMIGGDEAVVERLRPIFETLAPARDRGWGRVGAVGSGHYTKMIHNGIEYGLMDAYAEGFNILHKIGAGAGQTVIDAETAPTQQITHGYEFKLDQIAELWRHGSVVSSWLLDLLAGQLATNVGLDEFAGHVADSGEGRWTVQTAVDAGVPVPVLATALFARYTSRGEADFANRILSAMRLGFGGHQERAAARV
jgi:6-phosphogluconate dehydrogenase